MPSPFPGMDPYLECILWPDVHQALAGEIRNRLVPAVRPRYVARLAIKTIRENMPVSEINVMYPDVEIVRRQLREAGPTTVATVAALTPTITPALTIPLLELKMRMVTIEIYTVENTVLTQVVTLKKCV